MAQPTFIKKEPSNITTNYNLVRKKFAISIKKASNSINNDIKQQQNHISQ